MQHLINTVRDELHTYKNSVADMIHGFCGNDSSVASEEIVRGQNRIETLLTILEHCTGDSAQQWSPEQLQFVLDYQEHSGYVLDDVAQVGKIGTAPPNNVTGAIIGSWTRPSGEQLVMSVLLDGSFQTEVCFDGDGWSEIAKWYQEMYS